MQLNLDHVRLDVDRVCKPQPFQFTLDGGDYETKPIDDKDAKRIGEISKHTDAENVAFIRDLIVGDPPPALDAILNTAEGDERDAAISRFGMIAVAINSHFDQTAGPPARFREQRKIIQKQIEQQRR